jgi:cell division protein FtsQ
MLEALDWVEQASVRREFPNRLRIAVNERQAFALWQVDGTLSVIDRTGIVLSGLGPGVLKNPLVVTGEGANLAAAQLVNQLEAVPDLRARVRAASRLGLRRWNLYLDNGTKIMLPAEHAERATRELIALAQSNGLLSGAAAEVDLRVPGTIRVAVAMPEQASPETTASITGQ